MIMNIRILIADDHQLFREGLINLLSDASNIEVIGHAENGREAVEKSIIHKPDVVIMDIRMPELSGVEATAELKETLPEVKVIALSMHSETHYVKGMLEAGASGYIFKNCTYSQLIDAIETVNSGAKYLGSEITEVLIDDYLDGGNNDKNNINELTEREAEVLKLYAEGKTTRDISEALFVSVKTIGTHKQHIQEKLNLKSTVDMIKYALKRGMITLD